MLTNTKIRNVTKPGVYTDGPGRYGLAVMVKSGAHGIRRTFTQRMTIEGRRTMIGLGKAEFFTLSEARTMAFENARAVARGEPLPHGGTQRRGACAVRAVPTFAEAADSYIKLQSQGWKTTSRNSSNWRSSLAHAKAIADSPVDAVTTDDVVGIVTGLISAGKAPTAKITRQRIRQIFDWTIAKGYRSTNPANGEIDRILPKSNHRATHRAAVEHGDVAEVLAKVEAISEPTWHGIKGAFRFVVLTAARTSEVLGATWTEIDFDAKTWTIPASRMKAGKPHRVPLSTAAVEVLQEAHQRTHGSGLVFVSPRRKRLDEASLRRVMLRIGVEATVHGFRGAFKSWCMESGIARDVAEFSLAHSFMSDVEASYVRTNLLGKRRPVMEAWAAYVRP